MACCMTKAFINHSVWRSGPLLQLYTEDRQVLDTKEHQEKPLVRRYPTAVGLLGTAWRESEMKDTTVTASTYSDSRTNPLQEERGKCKAV